MLRKQLHGQTIQTLCYLGDAARIARARAELLL